MKAMLLLHWRMWMVVTVIWCQVARYLLLHLVTWLVASLELLYLPSGQLHVGVPHPLLIQLILGPEQHLQADCQLALCGVSMLCHENSSIELAGHLLPVCRGQQVCKRTAGWIIKSQKSKSSLQLLQHGAAKELFL